jgi:ribosomal-protein-alanine N-acetyltransferase
MMEISRMTEEHVPQVAALEAICFRDPWSEASVRSELTNPLSLWLVALEGESVIGYVGSQTVMGWSDMMNVAVHPDHRRLGVGKALIEELIRQLREQGSENLTLEVRASNENAKALYAGLDFMEVGRRKNYYHNPKEDALILRKEWTE